jgi:hypothetical protein
MPPANLPSPRTGSTPAPRSTRGVIARELFGGGRSHGYSHGGSGGSYQVIGAALNTEGVWGGFLLYVRWTPNAIPSMFTVRMRALRVLRQRGNLAAVIDAIDAGCGGDPYATLDDEERAALSEACLFGFPLRGWRDHEHLDSGYFYNVAGLVPAIDAPTATGTRDLPLRRRCRHSGKLSERHRETGRQARDGS